MNNASRLRVFPSRDALDRQLAEDVRSILETAVRARDHALLAVSGGKTPIGFFEHLAQQDMAWARVVVTLADERWVGVDNEDSNEKLVRQHLLRDKASTATFVGLKNAADTAQQGEQESDRRISQLGDLDVIVLGMGDDGHTASLFPGAVALDEALDLTSEKTCIAITPPRAPHERMSLTLAAILRAKRIFIHITGKQKKELLELAVDANDVTRLPIAAVLQQQRTEVRIYWSE